ncbi:DUF1127 domain-containing protein [Albimonas pacifica]|uniref:YjiS-like domain-containing protein n=1 Tax=Albimonas pacifica TaxID=1114924 RepID=A0A1I3J0X1_9RHOB|nr:DUF1127 domain-containing protein [Albimonas pacifica]SFI53912.1 protein of unknown function [Albimonas pacifica]
MADDLPFPARSPRRAAPSPRRPPDLLDLLALRPARRGPQGTGAAPGCGMEAAGAPGPGSAMGAGLRSGLRRLGAGLGALMGALAREGRRRRCIGQLQRLDDRHLRDLGIEDRSAIETLVREGRL